MKKLTNPRIWTPLLIFGAGIGLVAYLVGNKPGARKRANSYPGALVELTEVKPTNTRINLKTHGRVRAAQRVVVTAQVNGVVNWISPLLAEGQFFQEGDLLLTLDTQSSANLNYTLVKAPFNGVVQARHVDLGQNVNNGNQMAILVGSDYAEVLSDVPISRLEWLIGSKGSVKENAPNQFGLNARISMQVGDELAFWKARVERHLLELTPNGMMVQLILTVEDPFRLEPSKDREPIQDELDLNKKSPGIQLKNNSYSTLPLFIGAFVSVTIPGRMINNVIELPVQSLRDKNTVWIIKEETLEIRQVNIVHLEGDSFFVSSGLQLGDQVVISPLKGAANGLKVRISGSRTKNKYDRKDQKTGKISDVIFKKNNNQKGLEKKKWKHNSSQTRQLKHRVDGSPTKWRNGKNPKKKEGS